MLDQNTMDWRWNLRQSTPPGEPIPTTYLINPDADPGDWITVQLTCFAGEGPHKPPHDTWAIKMRGWCLDVDGDWIYEPLPSARDEGFFARCRWPLDEALARAKRAEP